MRRRYPIIRCQSDASPSTISISSAVSPYSLYASASIRRSSARMTLMDELRAN